MEEHHQIRVEIFSVVIIVQPASSCFQSTVDLMCVPMLIIQNILASLVHALLPCCTLGKLLFSNIREKYTNPFVSMTFYSCKTSKVSTWIVH